MTRLIPLTNFMVVTKITIMISSNMMIITISIEIKEIKEITIDMDKNNNIMSSSHRRHRSIGSIKSRMIRIYSIFRESPCFRSITTVTQWNPTSLRKISPNNLATSSFHPAYQEFLRDSSSASMPSIFTKETL